MTTAGGHERAATVVVADDEPHVVDYLRAVLHAEGFDVAGTARDADEVAQVVHHTHPDVVLLDMQMPGGGMNAAQLIGSLSPETHIVVFSGSADGVDVLSLLRAGVDGFVVKGSSPRRLGDAIRGVLAGGSDLAPEVGRVAIGALTERLHAEDQEARRHTRLRDRINDVVATAAYSIVLQPIVHVATGEPYGAEALTRFTGRPVRPPNEWFDEAAEAGLRTPLELATASAALRLIPQVRDDLVLTINCSPATALSGRLGEVLMGVDLTRVVLELTEHAPVDDYGALRAVLDPWREQGVRIAVDDAGGGYASFAHILKLAPELIKLDLALTRDIHTDKPRRALARALVGFADEMGALVVAEGIEGEPQLEVMAALGTQLAQGFHLGRPRPLDEQPALADPVVVLDEDTSPATGVPTTGALRPDR